MRSLAHGAVLVVLVLGLTAAMGTAPARATGSDEPMFSASDADFWNLMNSPYTAADPSIGGITSKDVAVQQGLFSSIKAGGRWGSLFTGTSRVAFNVFAAGEAFSVGYQFGGLIANVIGLEPNVGTPISPTADGGDLVGSTMAFEHTANTHSSGVWDTTINGPYPCGQVLGTSIQDSGCDNSANLQFTVASSGNVIATGTVKNTDQCDSFVAGGSTTWHSSSSAYTCGFTTLQAADTEEELWHVEHTLVTRGIGHLLLVVAATQNISGTSQQGAYTFWATPSEVEKAMKQDAFCTAKSDGTGCPAPDKTLPDLGPLSTPAQRLAVSVSLQQPGSAPARRWVDCELDPGSAWCTDPSKTDPSVEQGTTFVLPAPVDGETYEAYSERLRALGYVGQIDVADDAAAGAYPTLTPAAGLAPGRLTGVAVGDAATGPQSVLLFDPVTGEPEPWPVNAPKVTPSVKDIVLTKTPGVETGTGGGESGTGDHLDFTPITGLTFGCKFPYGLFCYAEQVTEWFNVTPTAPEWNFTIPDVTVAGHTYHVGTTYDVSLAFMDEYMGWIRDLIAAVLGIGVTYFVAGKLLGFDATGDVTGAVDSAVHDHTAGME